jgi:hypothetical protein
MWRASLPVWKAAIAPRGQHCFADVNPTFNWVRLARRVPVRVSLDRIPADETLVTGRTATMEILSQKPIGLTGLLGSPTPSGCSMVTTASRFDADPAQAGPYAATSPTGLRGTRPLQHEITRVRANEQFVVNLAAFPLAVKCGSPSIASPKGAEAELRAPSKPIAPARHWPKCHKRMLVLHHQGRLLVSSTEAYFPRERALASPNLRIMQNALI